MTSEAFERALRYAKSFDPDKGEPAAWLIGIARRCVDDRSPSVSPSSSRRPGEPPRDLEEDSAPPLELAHAMSYG